MLFNTLTFWVFFIAFFAVYVRLAFRPQNLFLLASSLFFYGCWDWRFVPLMILTAGIDYLAGQRIHESAEPVTRRRWLLLSLGLNLLILGFFKYFNFFVDSAIATLAAAGVHVEPWKLGIVLPVGISFYTFQSMAYTIDIYRRSLTPAKSLVEFLLFVAYFPHLVAGPINRPQGLLEQCQRPRRMTWEQCGEGLVLILVGLVKKVFVADQIAPLVEKIFSSTSYNGADVLIGGYAFALQIYTDFSGYTDIARGLAKLMGFELMENFRQPYLADTITDFWRRWHISLSTWLRDYLYIPLGGNRLGEAKTWRNLFLTMFLGGLWHGASWRFAIWGALHGVYLALDKIKDRCLARMTSITGPVPLIGACWRPFGIALTFHLVVFAWLFFRAPGSVNAIRMARRLIQDAPEIVTMQAKPGILTATQLWHLALLWMVTIVLIDLPQRIAGDQLCVLRWSRPWKVAYLTVLLIALLSVQNSSNEAFIYFQF